MPAGDPPEHWFFSDRLVTEVPRRFTLEIAGGAVVGDYAAHLTPGNVLDHETSPYFGTSDWREHPLFLRTRLPEMEHVSGTLLSLATRGSGSNYYHFLMDALPRIGILQESMPGTIPDSFFVNATTRYQRELLTMLRLDAVRLVTPGKHLAFRADRLLVPSLPNNHTIAPRFTTDWLRANIRPREVTGRPTHLFVTRGQRRNTRRLVNEAEIIQRLEPLGFVTIDPGALSVREQVDHFAAAEVVVGVHGAALTNLVFCQPGVRVLELFAPGYLNPGYWSILDNIAETKYRYLIGTGRHPRRGHSMTGVMHDITIDPILFDVALEDLLS